MGCEYLYGSMTAFFVKGECSRPNRSTFSSRLVKQGRRGTPGRKWGRGTEGSITTGDPAPATSVWGLVDAEDAGGVLQTAEQLREIMFVMATAWTALDLVVPEAKAEIMCLLTRGMPDAAIIFSVEAADQVQKHWLLYLGRTSNTTPICPRRSTSV